LKDISRQENRIYLDFEKWRPKDGIKFRIIVESLDRQEHCPILNIKTNEKIKLIAHNVDGNLERRNKEQSYENQGACGCWGTVIMMALGSIYFGIVMLQGMIQGYFEQDLRIIDKRSVFLSWTLIIGAALLIITSVFFVRSIMPKKEVKKEKRASKTESALFSPWKSSQ
jgi:hypothetical protein